MTQREDLQDRIFKALAEELLARLTAGHCKSCGRSAALPQELQAARQFLSDNGITGIPGRGRLGELTKKLPFQDPDQSAGLGQER